jgi:hypothetical protein
LPKLRLNYHYLVDVKPRREMYYAYRPVFRERYSSDAPASGAWHSAVIPLSRAPARFRSTGRMLVAVLPGPVRECVRDQVVSRGPKDYRRHLERRIS